MYTKRSKQAGNCTERDVHEAFQTGGKLHSITHGLYCVLNCKNLPPKQQGFHLLQLIGQLMSPHRLGRSMRI